jgi:ComEC/Rec2-related protein
MKRPLLSVALLYAAGIALASRVEVSLGPLFGAALGLTALALAWPRARPLLLGAVLFFAGWVNLGWRSAVLSPQDLRALAGDQPALVAVRGTLAATPAQRVQVRDEQALWRTLAPVEVTAIRFGQRDWEPARGTVQASTRRKSLTNFFNGQPVEVAGVLAPPPGPVVPGLFDYRAYLAWQGIYHQLMIESESDWRVVGPTNPPPWTERFRRWAQHTLARGLPVEDEPLQLQWAMVLGWKTALTGEVSEPFMRSGTMHIFAISGLHVVLIAGVLVALFGVVHVPRGACGVLVIPLLWFYTAATEWQASAIRAAIMMTVIVAGWSLRRPSDMLNSLMASAFFILLWDPRQLFQASFELSFCVVLSLALLLPPLQRVRQGLFDSDPAIPDAQRPWWQRLVPYGPLRPDPLLPPQLRPRWHRRLQWAVCGVLDSSLVSLASWVGSWPLIAYYFHLFTPVSLLANLVIVPLSGFALMCGLGGVFCGAWWPGATELFNHAGWFFMLAMVKASQWAADAPGAFYYVATPGLLTTGLFYAALWAVVGGRFCLPFRWWTLAGLSTLAAACVGLAWHDRAATRLAVLPLRGGHAIWADAPGRSDDWLIDCGDAASTRFVIKPYLRAQGVRTLPRLVLSHGDVRQVGGAANLWNDFRVGELALSPVRFQSPPYRQAVATWTNAHRPLRTLRAGDHLGSWTVLHPKSGTRFPRADDNALVLRAAWAGCRVLCCSDLSSAGQDALLRRQPDLRADIVVAGMPQGSEPLHEALLDVIQPRLIIIADSDNPAAERASPRLKLRLARRHVPVLFLRESKAVSLELRPGRWVVHDMSGTKITLEPRQD